MSVRASSGSPRSRPRHVPERAQAHRGVGELGVGGTGYGIERDHVFHQAEVEDLHLVACREEDVRRFEVPVNQPA